MKKPILKASILKRKSTTSNVENIVHGKTVQHKKPKSESRIPLGVISAKLKHLPGILKRHSQRQAKVQAQESKQQVLQEQIQQIQQIQPALPTHASAFDASAFPASPARTHAPSVQEHDYAMAIHSIEPTVDVFSPPASDGGSFEPAQESDLSSDSFKSSYSMISSSSFYETVPFEDEGTTEDVEDLKLFGLDLKKHSRLLRHRETTYLPKSNYMKWQLNLNPRMRMVLLYWLSEVCEEFELQRETWHIAVNCMDRFLSCTPMIDKSKLQLIGISALLVACKMEEYRWPSVIIMEQLADGACTQEQIRQMEKLMLQKIGWLLLPVTPYICLRLYLLILLKSKRNNTNNIDINTNFSNNINNENNNLLNNSLNSSLNSSTDYTMDNNVDENFTITRLCKGAFKDIESEFPIKEFVKMMQVIDIAMMDYASLNYTPSMIAASVLYVIYIPDEIQLRGLTSYRKNELRECVEWIRPFTGVPLPKYYDSAEAPYHYCLQTSNANAKAFLENYLGK